MTPDDRAALHAECFTTPRPWSAQEFSQLLSSTGIFVIDRTSGFAMGRVVADEVELLTIAVASSARRMGCGRNLMTAFMNNAKYLGAATAFLEVAADNEPAIRLYRASGFVQTGWRPNYYVKADGTGAIDAVVMSCRLADT
ncbi:GNAT family N-acetyltransferase [Qingshengfaniella alkalisoli]|uniref:GNAT family N-acetyltransferase n=1 Tax=Qingshengfaniella alkalisoli TaxID=2599296 RepID=A0A5B8IS49_9RHOB|nr:GNAT family N-acetyltransferase [Qingshengfaniella alkalisoli]QDY68414.1 GNAT family N-acetyltransferase [Qingshengfaniella alkalisoli]